MEAPVKQPAWAFGIAAAAGALFLGISFLQGDAVSNAAPAGVTIPQVITAAPVCLTLDQTGHETYWSDALSTHFRGSTEQGVTHGRVDVLTADFAIEVDWFKKFHEGIGQALHYAMESGKQPAVALIVKPDEAPLNEHMVSKLALIERLTDRHGISLFILYEEATCPAPRPAQTAMQ